MRDEMPPSSHRRSRQIAARRVQILDAAARLFAEKGFHRTTTRDIANMADVSEGTLYNYFASKDDLLLGIMTRLGELQQFDDRLESSLPIDARDFFRSMLNERKRYIDQNRDMLQSIFSEIFVNPQLRASYYQELVQPGIDILKKHLQARIEQGHVRKVDHELLVRLVFALTSGLFILDMLHDPLLSERWDELASLIVSVIFEGVVPTNEARSG